MAASWESWKQAKRTAVEYLAVFIASIGFIFGCIGLLVGMTAIWIAYDANENAKVAIIRLENHMQEHDQ